METRKIIYLLTALCFSLLFYNQGVGVNYLLMGVVLVGGAIITDKHLLHSWNWRLVSAGLIISTFFSLYYGNAFAVTMSVLSVLMFQSVKKWHRSSIIASLVSGFSSVLFSPFLMVQNKIDFDKVQSRSTKTVNKIKTNIWLPIVAVVVVAIVFLSLYRAINPVFDKFTSEIGDFISWGWFFFTLMGFVLLFTFFFPSRIFRKILSVEELMPNDIKEISDVVENKFCGSPINFDNERLSAVLMFSVLNVMLFFLNLTDVNYLFIESVLPEGVTHTEYVHNGVGAVITSIVLAIALMLFYYRGKMNFDNRSKSVNILTYVWIVQNVVLVVLTMFKNQMYVDAFALTFKRIGVYYYLGFSIIGLALTAYKLYACKTTWFLVKSNAVAMYTVLILSSALNWNMIVTANHFGHEKGADLQYLKGLGFANYPELWEADAFNNDQSMTVEFPVKGETKSFEVPSKVGRFINDYQSDGVQSYGVTKQRVYDYFKNLAEQGTLTFQALEVQVDVVIPESSDR